MVTIRQLLESDDLLAVSDIYEKSWKYAYRGIIPASYLDSIPRGQWANNLKAPGRRSLLLFDDGRLLGTASYCGARMENMEGWGEIVSIYFLPEAMHKGYGRTLMSAAMEELKKQGYKKVYLWVLEENITARQFYEHMGFAPSGRTQTGSFAGKEVRELQYILE